MMNKDMTRAQEQKESESMMALNEVAPKSGKAGRKPPTGQQVADQGGEVNGAGEHVPLEKTIDKNGQRRHGGGQNARRWRQPQRSGGRQATRHQHAAQQGGRQMAGH